MRSFLFTRLALFSGASDLVARMPVQTTYGSRIAPAYEGMIANSEPEDIKSMTVETAAGIGFGKVACQGVADDGVIVAAATKKFRGITVSAHFTAGTGVETVDVWPQYDTIPVMIKGVIWVMASVAVAVGDPVYFVPATGVLTNVVGGGNTLIPNAIWESSTPGAALAKVRLG